MSLRTDHLGVFEKQVRALCEGFRRELPASIEVVVFGGQRMTMGELVASIERIEESFSATRRAERAFRQALAERRRAMKGFRSLYGDAVLFLKQHLGKESPRLTRFGVQLPKPRRPLTAEARAIAKARAEATRKARGTLGKRQRLALGRPREPTLEVFGPDGRPLVVEEKDEPEATPPSVPPPSGEGGRSTR